MESDRKRNVVLIYGEKTVSVDIRVPVSKKAEVRVKFYEILKGYENPVVVSINCKTPEKRLKAGLKASLEKEVPKENKIEPTATIEATVPDFAIDFVLDKYKRDGDFRECELRIQGLTKRVSKEDEPEVYRVWRYTMAHNFKEYFLSLKRAKEYIVWIESLKTK